MKPEIINTKNESVSAAMEIGLSEIDGKESLVVKGLMDNDEIHYTFIPLHLFAFELIEAVLYAKQHIKEIKQALN